MASSSGSEASASRSSAPRGDRLGQGAAVRHLLPAEADGPERRLFEREEALGADHWPARRLHPPPDRRRRPGRELLRDHDAQERREPGLALPRRRIANLLQRPRDIRIDLREAVDPADQAGLRQRMLHSLFPIAEDLARVGPGARI